MRFFTFTTIAIFCLGSFFASLKGYNVPHFYRAQQFVGEPRFEEPWLFSIEAYVTGGSTHHSYNSNGKKAPLFSLYGTNALKKNQEFGLEGTFSVTELDINGYANLCNGFFLHAFAPFVQARMSTITFVRRNAATPLHVWDDVKKLEIPWCGFTNTGNADFFVGLGWTLNYEESDFFDFIDLTIQTDGIIPTSKPRNEERLFDIPLGYDGYSGVHALVHNSYGLLNWITLGIALEGVFFNTLKQKVRVATSADIKGLITDHEITADVHHGPIYVLAGYFKADHLLGGLSFLCGYNYSHRLNDSLCIKNERSFHHADPARSSWTMQTVHIAAEYDFATDEKPYLPKLIITYDKVVQGRHVLATWMLGGILGFDFSMQF